ncbi:MAG: hypothetical protein K2F73_07055, partial [Ruminococcus sp.]|nr:hypothetical protein [Ruminococcus sp.]
LTLGNIQINCNGVGHSLNFPDNGRNTIVIAEGANPIVSEYITCANSSLTITGKGTLTIVGKISQSEHKTNDELTITGGAEVISNGIYWGTNGGIAINEGGKLNISRSIDTAKIIMDDTAVLEMNADTAISFVPIPDDYLADIKKYFPSGYKLEQTDINECYIIPKSASVVFNEESGGYDLLYKDGTPVTGKVTLKANQQTDTGEKLVGHSISLKGNIGVNFYMELDNKIAKDENAYMQFTLPDGDTQTVNVSDATESEVDGKTYYVFSCEVAAKEMFDTITAQMITSDGEGTVYEYSVKEYADYITSHSNDYYDDTINLVESMMNYGKYAKSYFSNEKTTDISDVTANNLTGFEKQTNGTLPDGIEYYGSSLLLESETTVRHYFKAAKGTD